MAILKKKRLDEESLSIGTCVLCGKPIIDVHPDEVRMIKNGPVHDDCYFDDFSKELDKHPIGIPRMHH